MKYILISLLLLILITIYYLLFIKKNIENYTSTQNTTNDTEKIIVNKGDTWEYKCSNDLDNLYYTKNNKHNIGKQIGKDNKIQFSVTDVNNFEPIKNDDDDEKNTENIDMYNADVTCEDPFKYELNWQPQNSNWYCMTALSWMALGGKKNAIDHCNGVGNNETISELLTNNCKEHCKLYKEYTDNADEEAKVNNYTNYSDKLDSSQIGLLKLCLQQTNNDVKGSKENIKHPNCAYVSNNTSFCEKRMKQSNEPQGTQLELCNQVREYVGLDKHIQAPIVTVPWQQNINDTDIDNLNFSLIDSKEKAKDMICQGIKIKNDEGKDPDSKENCLTLIKKKAEELKKSAPAQNIFQGRYMEWAEKSPKWTACYLDNGIDGPDFYSSNSNPNCKKWYKPEEWWGTYAKNGPGDQGDRWKRWDVYITPKPI